MSHIKNVAHTSSAWSDDDIESLLMTVGALVITSFVGWYFIVRPVRRKAAAPPAVVPPEAVATSGRTRRQHFAPPSATQHRNNYIDNNDDGILAMLRQKTRVPPHYYLASASSTPQTHHDGVVPFRQTKASIYDSSLASTDEDLLFQHRKDRARVFTRMFKSPPPPRGSCMVLAINAKSCSTKTSRVILLLASYYNLFLLLQLDDDKMEEDFYVSQLRQVIPPNILPTHRIISTGSHVGRVAFCRQLPKQPELVLDFDDMVKSQLTRFGFQVMICKNLGEELLP
mmetsp:Transcript_13384/g.12977  ORF Transcript_13384/g.12977 Transcript_13384/m.12977 type:complete len:284 (-) Transcript_13384:121-972(-)